MKISLNELIILVKKMKVFENKIIKEQSSQNSSMNKYSVAIWTNEPNSSGSKLLVSANFSSYENAKYFYEYVKNSNFYDIKKFFKDNNIDELNIISAFMTAFSIVENEFEFGHAALYEGGPKFGKLLEKEILIKKNKDLKKINEQSEKILNFKERLEIGSSPSDEKCAQVGSDNYKERVIKELTQYKRMCLNLINSQFENIQIDLRTKSFPHDFGSYYELCVYFDPNVEESVEQAFWLEENVPQNWDDEAKTNLSQVN